MRKKHEEARSVWSGFLALLCLCFYSLNPALANSFEERRVQVGMKLFRTLLTSDLKLKEKVHGEKSIPVLMVYASDKDKAESYRQQLESLFKNVKHYTFKVKSGSIQDLASDKENQYAAIFFAQKIEDDELSPVVKFGIDKKIIVFSPFEGDVERGVLGGISVQATVRPLINMLTLKKSNLSIKPFFLKVAKQYE